MKATIVELKKELSLKNIREEELKIRIKDLEGSMEEHPLQLDTLHLNQQEGKTELLLELDNLKR